MGIHLIAPLYKMVIAPPNGELTETFYPDADPENTSVDGHIFYVDPGLFGGYTWAELLVLIGNNPRDYYLQIQLTHFFSSSTRQKWKGIGRSVILFDTSYIPIGKQLISAVLSLFGDSKVDALRMLPDINLYSSDPTSNTSLINVDLTRIGSIPFCDTPISYNDWDTNGWNDFILNPAGLAAIIPGGITKLGLRNASHDVAGVSPFWRSFRISEIYCLSAETPDATKRPKLVVTYQA